MPIVRPSVPRVRMQIALLLGTIVLVLIAALSALLGHLRASALRTEAATVLQGVAAGAERALSAGLLRRLQIVERLAGTAELWREGLGDAGVRDALARQLAGGDDVAWLGVADADGIVQAATGDLLVGANVAARPWFAAGLRGAHVGDVHQALLLAKLLPPSRTGEPRRFVDFAVPIRVDGETRGVLALHGSWDWVRSVIAASLPADRRAMDLFVLDRAGTVLYAPGGQDRHAVKVGDALGSIARPDLQTGSVFRWPDGHDYLTSATAVETRNVAADLGWSIVARTPTEQVFATVDHAMTHVAWLGAVAAVLALILAWRVSGSISKPLSAFDLVAPVDEVA